MSNKLKIEKYISDNILDMSLLQLREIPAKVKTNLPKSVNTLNFSNNIIISVPPIICTLIQIREINLSKNKLEMLPDELGDLINLTKLDLYDNQLTFLPLSFYKLKKLKWLDISSNPIPQALAGIAGPCQTAKECENAASNIVRYFGVLNAKVVEEYEKIKKLELEKQKAEEKNVVREKKEKSKSKRDAGKTTQPHIISPCVKTQQSDIKRTYNKKVIYILFPFIAIGVAYVVAKCVDFTNFPFVIVGLN